MRHLTLGLALLPLAACTGGESDSDTDAVTGPLYAVVNRVRTIGERTNYVTLVDDLGPQEIVLDDSLEVPGTSRVLMFDGRIYTFEGETAQVARYAVDAEGQFVEEGRFSMADLGVTGLFYTSIGIIDADTAYYVNPEQAQIVVWDPTEMVIVDTVDVPGLRNEDFALTVIYPPSIMSDEIVFPFGWRTGDQTGIFPTTAILAISTTDASDFAIHTDDRCFPSAPGVAIGDSFYALGDSGSGVYDIYNPDPLPPPCFIRYDAGSDGFSEDPVLSTEALTGAPYVAGVFGIEGSRAVMRVYDADFAPETIPGDYPNPADYFALEVWRWAVVDLEAETSTLLEDLPLTGLSFNPQMVEGVAYVPVIDEESQVTTVYAVDGTETSESVTVTGDVLGVYRIR